MQTRALVLTLFLAGPATAATLVGTDATLTTRDGKKHQGRVLAETANGYLLRTPEVTEVVEFAQIVDLSSTDAALPPASATSSAPAREDRLGFRVGIGLGGFGYPWATSLHTDPNGWYFQGALVVPVTYDFGRVGLAVTAILGGAGHQAPHQGIDGGPALGLDAQMRVHVTRRYSFGVGLFQGALNVGGLDYAIGPSLTAVNVALGDGLQHQVSLWATLPVVPAASASLAPPLVLLGYAYVF